MIMGNGATRVLTERLRGMGVNPNVREVARLPQLPKGK
jgi:hypothetical protein